MVLGPFELSIFLQERKSRAYAESSDSPSSQRVQAEMPDCVLEEGRLHTADAALTRLVAQKPSMLSLERSVKDPCTHVHPLGIRGVGVIAPIHAHGKCNILKETGTGLPLCLLGRQMLGKAYKQVPVSNASLKKAVIAMPSRSSEWVFCLARGLPLGGSGSVFSLNKISRALWHIAVVKLGLITSVYVDDYPTFEIDVPRHLASCA